MYIQVSLCLTAHIIFKREKKNEYFPEQNTKRNHIYFIGNEQQMMIKMLEIKENHHSWKWWKTKTITEDNKSFWKCFL